MTETQVNSLSEHTFAISIHLGIGIPVDRRLIHANKSCDSMWPHGGKGHRHFTAHTMANKYNFLLRIYVFQ